MDETTSDACHRCGYNLTGIADDQPCPECGLLAERSRRVTDELHQTRPRWLRRLSWGVWLILLAVVSPVPLSAAVAFAITWLEQSNLPVWRPRTWAGMLLLHLPVLALDVAAMIFSAGVLLLSSREGYPPADRADARLRLTLRLALTGPLAALVLLHVGVYAVSNNYWRADQDPVGHMELFIQAVATLCCVPLPLLLAVRLRGLARRARSAHLAEHCLIVGIGVALTLVYAVAVSVVMEYADSWGWGSNWAISGTPSLLIAVILATLGVLFVLWALYLMVRFAVAFGRASRLLRRQWRRDDRAAVAA